MEKAAIKVKKLSRKEFPPNLLEIPDAPEELQIIGKLPDHNKYKYLTVVGSRAVTSYGRRALNHLIEGLRGYPIVIVSGLALGTDALAHKKALEIALPTIAVPGSGLSKEVLYPKSHFSLALEIVRSGGALLSEFDFKQAAAPWTFPKRNRIMAALSDAVLVIEAKEKSGTLITARLATEYNKELLVVPGDIFSDAVKGNLQFLKLGATPVTEPGDILDALGLDEQPDVQTASLHDLNLPEDELLILNALDEAKSKDELLEASGLSVSKFNIAFSKLELKGLIKEELGKVFKTF